MVLCLYFKKAIRHCKPQCFVCGGTTDMFKKSVAMLAIIAGLSAGSAQALSLKKGAQPAEYPPASFTGDTYVDSRGCVYIRAGFAGNVTWVPRVSRSRKVLCGAQPTGGASQAQTIAAQAPTPAEVAAEPVAAPVVAAPAPKPQPLPKAQSNILASVQPAPVANVAPLPKAIQMSATPRPVRSTGAAGPALPPAVGFGAVADGLPPRAQPAPLWSGRYAAQTNSGAMSGVPVTNQAGLGRVETDAILANDGPVTRTVRVNCPARSGVSQVYLNGTNLPVRCGPQQIAPVSYVVAGGNGQRTRVVTMPHPSNVAAYTPVSATASYAPVPVTSVTVNQGVGHAPRQYNVVRRRDLDKSVLSPSTVIAPQTYVASNMPVVVPQGYKPAWGDDRLNPMRGVRTIGGDAQSAQIWTEKAPRQLIGVQLPKQNALTGAKIFGRKAPRSGTLNYVPVPVYGSPAVGGAETLSTRGAPISATKSVSAQAASHRYVQVGGFADPAQARNVIIKLQRMGMTVSSLTSKSGVKTIMAGPFSRQTSLTAALSQLRGAGFANAKLRK